MATKIKVVHLTAFDNYLFAIDDKGRVWRRSTGNATDWVFNGEVPDEPAAKAKLNVATVSLPEMNSGNSSAE